MAQDEKTNKLRKIRILANTRHLSWLFACRRRTRRNALWLECTARRRLVRLVPIGKKRVSRRKLNGIRSARALTGRPKHIVAITTLVYKGGFTQNPATAYKPAYGQRQSSHMQQERYRRQPRQSGLLQPILCKP